MTDSNAALARLSPVRLMLVAAFAAAALFVVRMFAQRAFVSATGFIPFDAQFPLRPQSIAIQLGAYADAETAEAYLAYALSDALLAAASACAITLLWMWIFAKQPNRLFAFLARGGIMFVPVVAAILDILENIGFYRLTAGLKGDGYARAIELTATAHNVKVALTSMRDFLTLLFIAVALTLAWRRSRKTSG